MYMYHWSFLPSHLPFNTFKKIFIDLYQGCFPADFSSYNLLANQMYKEVLAKVEESNGMYT